MVVQGVKGVKVEGKFGWGESKSNVDVTLNNKDSQRVISFKKFDLTFIMCVNSSIPFFSEQDNKIFMKHLFCSLNIQFVQRGLKVKSFK